MGDDSESPKVVEGVRARLELAKLSVDELVQPVQTLKFKYDASDQKYMLFELDDDLLKHIEDGKRIVIRGNADDTAVLCTDEATYDIKKAETSNTNILVPECSYSKEGMKDFTPAQISGDEPLPVEHREAVGWTFNYIELKRKNPDTHRIIELLVETLYKGPQFETENDTKDMFTLSKLLDIVQASELEIMEFLSKSNICCIDGYWRMLDFGYIVECMGEILQLIEAESWGCDKIPVDEMCVKINDQGELVPKFIVKHLLKYYGSPSEDSTDIWKLDGKKVCQFYAEMLLRDVGKFNYLEFVQTLKGGLPKEMDFNEDYLKGHSLIDQEAKPPTISLLKVEDLPMKYDAMFDELFKRKEKWSFEDIVPYIEPKCLKGETASAVLTRYARTSTFMGQKLFSTRKPNFNR